MVDSVPFECREYPFCHVVRTEDMRRYCSHCCRKQTFRSYTWPTCSECRLNTYCSYNCELADLPFHRLECKRLCRIRDWRDTPNSSWMEWGDYLACQFGEHWWKWPDPLIRLVGRLDQKLSMKQWRNYASNGRCFDDLKEYSLEICESKKHMTDFKQFFRSYANFVGCSEKRLDKFWILLLYTKAKANMVGITDSNMRNLGLGLYLSLSRIPHSCDPSARIVFQGSEAVAIPSKWHSFRQPFNWDELRVSYIDELASTAERRALIEEEFFRVCQCKGCLNADRDAEMTALVCPDDKCKGKLVLARQKTEGSRCMRCKLHLSEEETTERLETAEMYLHLVEKTMNDSGATIHDKIECCEEVAEELQNYLYKRNTSLLNMYNGAFEYCLDKEKFREGWSFGRLGAEGRRSLFGKYDARALVYMARAAHCCSRGAQPEQATELLFNSTPFYIHIHGKGTEAMDKMGQMISDAQPKADPMEG